ncbi:MAG: sulfite exporter TauE/SafE family protein [Gammaproteobacteria bacterium]|nr:sulfite exporter TauE/SafE family protein [Gammaproteobacteria bacterium]
MIFEIIILFSAGILGGVINAIAGGGSFITFPALLLIGVNPISANATNTLASCAGYISGTFAFRKEISKYKNELTKLILVSFLGAILGAWLLLQISEAQFHYAIPWLLLFATILFIFGSQINEFIKKTMPKHRHVSLLGQALLIIMLLAVATYGGFFNAGLGFIALSYFALSGYKDINAMNGLKLLISSIVSLVAVIIFIFNDLLAWYEGTVMLIGSMFGGYIASHYSKMLPQKMIRMFVIVLSCGITLYFFVDLYGDSLSL